MTQKVGGIGLRLFCIGGQNRPMTRRSINHIGRILLPLILTATLAAHALGAATHYFVRVWQVESGLPQNKVTAVLQTQDGYLWLGTYNGLARFDGVHFTVFNDNNTSELPSSRITSLFEAADGTLWIGDESGHVTEYKQGQFSVPAFHPKWSGGNIYQITSDDAGDVWIMNEFGELARARDGLVLTPPAGIVAKVVAMARSADGTIWIARAGAMSELKNGKLSTVQLDTPSMYIQGICAGQDGGLWVAGDLNIREWKDGKWIKDLGKSPWGASIVAHFIELKNGVLAAGTSDGGLYLVSPDHPDQTVHFGRTSGFPSDWVISLWEDREGNLWSGTGAGLVMVRPNNLETVSPPDGWHGRAVLSVCADTNNGLWIGTEGAGLYCLKNGTWTNFDAPQGIMNPYIWSLAENARGQLYVGTWGGGLFQQSIFQQSSNAFQFAPGMEKITPPMPALLSASNDLWIGTTEGLIHYQNTNAEWLKAGNAKFSADVRAIAKDSAGAIWIGTAGNGLVRSGSSLTEFKKEDGLSSDFIECLHFTADGTLWIGTFGGGLDRYKDGHFSVINTAEGLPNNVICHIEEDAQGYFWISSYNGIFRVSETDLNDCADGKTSQLQCVTYGVNDGMPTLECSEGMQPAGCQSPDGRLWFPTAKGLVSLDPSGVTLNPLPPPVVIEELQVDDKPFAEHPPDSTLLKIAPGRHRFDFFYTGLSFVAPEKIQFKCRLNGIDPDWVDAGTKRTASYNYIPPGNYSFQVIACNNDGVWNETGATVDIDVLPYFWQTMWFRTLAVAMLIVLSGGLVWFDTRKRMHRRLDQAERQRDIERERTRIARDIHDDLGSHLTRITMLSESARSDLGNPVRVITGLEHIYNTARELTRSMDEIVWAVNPRHDTLESLANYLEKFAQDLLATANIRCRLDMPMQFPEWYLTSEVRHNLFLACKEALHNVLKHSGASEVKIRLAINAKDFELSIEDNGCGFSTASKLAEPPEGSARPIRGNGLENMQRRLSGIDGSCNIQSEPGKGTKIILKVRFKAAAV